MKTKCMGARCIGSNHDICQDEILYTVKQNYSLIAVSDGAGSKRFSQLGAKTILGVLERYFDKYDFDKINDENAENASKEICESLMYLMKSGIHTEAWRKDVADNECACTLVFVICTDDYYISGHIGDGGILSLIKDSIEVVSLPENGEYKNVTYFVTDDDAIDHFRISVCKNETERKAFLVCTDGIGDLLFKAVDETIKVSDVSRQLCNWLIDAESEKDINEVGMAYEANLRNVFSKKSKDDLSFCVLAKA